MEQTTESPQSPLDAFPEGVQQDIDGLIWLGYLEDSFSYCGHDFVIRLLRGDEELTAGVVTKDYVETLGQVKAHIWATIALALVAVDGAEDFCPAATPNKRDHARARFNWVSSSWYWPTALHIYNKYTDLQRRQGEALEALEDFSQGSLSTPTPFAGSWIDRAPSEDPPQEDIREFLKPPEA